MQLTANGQWTMSRDFCFRLFHESPSPKPLKITLGSFPIFSKIRGDIRKSRCTTGVNDTGGKIAAGQRHRRQILPPVPLVLLTPVAWGKLIHEKNHRKSRYTAL
jgi:hypothetical protein